MATTLPATILDRLERAAGRPRLTWYDTDGRIELSGHVLANWTIKTTNLLVEEFDVAPGSRILLDLPPHWRAAVWTLAAWRTGAEVVVAGPGDGLVLHQTVAAGDVVVTSRPASWRDTPTDLVAVALPGLARRFDGELPAGAIDAASAVMTYSDQLGYVPATEPASTALSSTGRGLEVKHEDLADALTRDMARAGHGEPFAPGATTRALATVDGDDLRGLLATCAIAWANDASIVAVPTGLEAARRERIAADERVTEQLAHPHYAGRPEGTTSLG